MILLADPVEQMFWAEFRRTMDRCFGIVDQRRSEGRDAMVPMMDKFPHGIGDLIFMCHAKVTRILGAEKMYNNSLIDPSSSDAKGQYAELERLRQVIEREADDLIVWAAFLRTYLERE